MNIYESIATRTNGNIYVGVVGPVRTGKSTFISRFMESMVIPHMTDKNLIGRTRDELPQSGAGRTIMTMQPRFVPSDYAEISLEDNIKAKVRLVDCVGYLIDGIQGHTEDGLPRLVTTPWNDSQIPFEQAAEIGTSKVITEHSTIGIVVTTDGSVTDIPRINYTQAEERVINELKELNKPFIIVLNSNTPDSEDTIRLKQAMEDKYEVPVVVKNVKDMDQHDFIECFEKVLLEFPVKQVSFSIPNWMRGLPEDNEIVAKLLDEIRGCNIDKMLEKGTVESLFRSSADILSPELETIDLSTGEMEYAINVSSNLFYKTLSSVTGVAVANDLDLMNYIADVAFAKKEYDKLKHALLKASETGYGVVVPTIDEMELSRPEIIKKAGANGVKLRAKAPSLHIMKVDVETEVTPAVGGVDISEEENAEEPNSKTSEIWNTTMFGKTLTDIAHDGIVNKLNMFPEEAEIKMRRTLSKITNEGKGGIICILL